MKRIGFIGAGNMGGAILRGILDAGYVKPEEVSVFDKNRTQMGELAGEYPLVNFCADAAEVVEQSDMLICAVKPNVLGGVLQELRPLLGGKAVISIAAGWTVAMLREALQDSGATWLRVMPNTPAMVGEGMTALCAESTFSAEDFSFAKGIFEAVGRAVILPEYEFDGVISVSGSSPAYVYMLIDAMADGAVREGIPRATAIEMAAQSVLGSALMVLSAGEHPDALKDAVCSPAGTTIEAVAALEQGGFRAAVLNAMRACAEKSRAMSAS